MKALLVHYRRRYGPSVDAIVAEAAGDSPIDAPFIEDETNWISFDFAQRLIESFTRASGNPDYAREAGREVSSPAVLGAAHSLLRAFGSPQLLFRAILRLLPLMNRVGKFEVEHLTRTSLRLTYLSSIAEPNRHFCEYRMGQFESLPEIWGLPRAEAIESTCQVNGDPRCTYEFKWLMPARYLPTFLGAALGGAAATTANILGMSGQPEWLFLLLGAMVGAAAGRLTEQRRLLRERDALLRQQRDDITDSLVALQKRFEENQALAATLERKVEERTDELQQTSAQLAEALKAQVALDAAKTRFFTNLTHELRTPLTLALAPLEAILEESDNLTESQQEQLHLARRNALRLLRLVDDLLTLARIEAGGVRFRVAQLDLAELAREMLQQVEPLAARKKISMALRREGDQPLQITADASQIERVVVNLLANAVKFTDEGGEVRLALVGRDDGVELAVEDTGIGIPAAELTRIFDRFHQVDGSNTRRYGGTGIGLALSREIVELHGGTIVAESRLEEGTTIRLWLPQICRIDEASVDRRSAVDSQDRIERRSELGLPDWHQALRSREEYRLLHVADASERRLIARVRPAAKLPRLLVVEDNLDMVRLLGGLLNTDYEIIAASDGEMGLELARQRRPDLILSDVMMPKMSGFEFIDALRADARTQEIPICLLTARGELAARIEGRSHGADAHLVKPFQPRELRATLQALLTTQDRQLLAARGERDSAMRTLAAGVAHEILNPLGFLQSALVALRESASELAAGGADPQVASQIERFAASGKEGIRRVKVAVAALQRFSRGGDAAAPEPTALHEVVEVVMTLVGSEPWHAITDSRLEATQRVPMQPGQIEQVLINLLMNAFHAAGADSRITLRTWDEPGGVALAVTDRGPGIPQENLEEIFNPFFTTKAPGEGTGLGLALARQIAREHRGSLTVESELGQGATFTLRLPGAEPAA